MDAKTLESELKNYRIREGVIYKRSKFLQEWRERWMVLTMNYILIYTNKSLNELTDALDLREIKSYKSYVRKDQEMIPAGFKIRTQEEMYYFCSRNCNEKWSWLVSFERVMDFKYAGASAYNSVDYIKTRGFMSQAEFEAGKFDIPSIFPQSQSVAPKQITQESKYQAEIERIKKQLEAQMNQLKLKEDLLKQKERQQEKLLRDKQLQQKQLLKQKQIEQQEFLRQKDIEREQQLKLLEREREESLRAKEEQLKLMEKEKETLLTQKLKERQLLIQQIEEEKLLQLTEKEKQKYELIKQGEKTQESKYLQELQRLKKQLRKKESEKVVVEVKAEEKSKVEKFEISQISVGKVAELRKLYENKMLESSKPTQHKIYVASQKQENSPIKQQQEKSNIIEPTLKKVVSQPQTMVANSSVETKVEAKSEVKQKPKAEVKEEDKVQVKVENVQIKIKKPLSRQQLLISSRNRVLEGLFDQFNNTAFNYEGLPYIIDFLMKMTVQKNLGYKQIFSAWAKNHENRFNFSQAAIKIIKDFKDYKNSNLLCSFIELLFGEAAGLFRGVHLSLVQKKLIQILLQVREDKQLQGVLKAMCVLKRVRIFEGNETVRQLLLGLSLGSKESLVRLSGVLLVDF